MWKRTRACATRHIINLLWSVWMYFCCGSSLPLRWETVAVYEWGVWVERRLSAIENPATAQCIWLSSLCLGLHLNWLMQFVYSHITAAHSKIWPALCGTPYPFFSTQQRLGTEWKFIIFIFESDTYHFLCLSLKWRLGMRYLALEGIQGYPLIQSVRGR